ncbi:MAG: hypothetical protein IBJ13_08950 [Sphingopyxis sp.]|nr:hypothetical protein [Sphingopyxis sp.]
MLLVSVTQARPGMKLAMPVMHPDRPDTAYVVGSITLGGSPLTDNADADAGDYNGSRVRVLLGTVAGGQTRTVTFRTRIN